jgi:hypothetical protein
LAAANTRSFVSFVKPTFVLPLKMSDTLAWETPASAATSLEVGFFTPFVFITAPRALYF